MLLLQALIKTVTSTRESSPHPTTSVQWCPLWAHSWCSVSSGRVDEDPPRWGQHVPGSEEGLGKRLPKGLWAAGRRSTQMEHQGCISSCLWGEGRAGPGRRGAAWLLGSGPPLGGAVGALSLFLFPAQHYTSTERVSQDISRGLSRALIWTTRVDHGCTFPVLGTTLS